MSSVVVIVFTVKYWRGLTVYFQVLEKIDCVLLSIGED